MSGLGSHTLALDWAYGYRGECRNNLVYNSEHHLVYSVAGLGVVHNPKDNKQLFYTGHTGDITCLGLHIDGVYVATAQAGPECSICVWDSTTRATVSILKETVLQGGVRILSFNNTTTEDEQSSNLLLSVGMEQRPTIIVWNWKRAKIRAQTTDDTEMILSARFHEIDDPHKQDTRLVTCGLRHIKFWQLCGNVLTPTMGVMRNDGKIVEVPTLLCLGFGLGGVVFAGALTGFIIQWKTDGIGGQMDTEQSVEGANVHSDVAHTGGVDVICDLVAGFATAGRDHTICLWDKTFQQLSTIVLQGADFDQETWIRSMHFRKDRLVFGTFRSDIYTMFYDQKHSKRLLNGHSSGELWGLATSPNANVFVTGGDDQTVRLWNIADHKLLACVSLDAWVRSCAFSPDGMSLAAGLRNGAVWVLHANNLEKFRPNAIHDRQRPIHELKYSPKSEYLAVGCNDGSVDVYQATKNYKLLGTCNTKHCVEHLDWSSDSKFVQVSTAESQDLVYFKVPECTMVNEPKNVSWATWTCIQGKDIAGIWPKYAKTSFVNAVDVNFEKKLVATGDDAGLVKLFVYPAAKKGAKCLKFTGHSAHVANVYWARDNATLISVGGADHAIFQWRLVSAGDARQGTGHIDSGDDIAPEDADAQEAVDIDSDIEREMQSRRLPPRSSKVRVTAHITKELRKELKEEGAKREAAPDAGLTLETAFGYLGCKSRSNVFVIESGKCLLYHVAAIGIVLEIDTGQQKFYIGHTDDIASMAVYTLPDKKGTEKETTTVATGQLGKLPEIHVWDAETLKVRSILKGGHTGGVCCLDFFVDGSRLVSAGTHEPRMIVIWDWKRGEKLASASGYKGDIFGVCFHPEDKAKLVSVGDKHIKFWNHAGGGLTANKGVFGTVAPIDTMNCVCYDSTNMCYSGASSGMIYVWKETRLVKVVKAHTGPCFAIRSLNKGFATGGKDGRVCLWSPEFGELLKNYEITSSLLTPESPPLVKEKPVIRAVALARQAVYAGTINGEILEIGKTGSIRNIVQGHGAGELWGLDTHPSEQTCCTVSDDCFLRTWSLDKRRMIARLPVNKIARSVAYSPDGQLLGVGFKDGSFAVYKTAGMTELFHKHDRKECISDVKFSPGEGRHLAVASHDNVVDIYDVAGQKRTGICKGASSYITHIDWAKDGVLLQVNSGAKEILYFEAPMGNRVVLDEKSLAEVKWNTWTCILGSTCQGIFYSGSDVTDVNTACLHPNLNLLATGDDLGYVRLFGYPVKTNKQAKSKKYLGHSAHVTNVRWTHDGSRLISVGGDDIALLVWKLSDTAQRPGDRKSDTSDTDSEEEGGYDSDVAREKNINYAPKMYSKPLVERLEGAVPNFAQQQQKHHVSRDVQKPINVKRFDASKLGTGTKVTQDIQLKLEHIFGFRGFDCNNNLFYLDADGTEIVYHAAGAGIVQHRASGQQRFYLKHSDDIIALAVYCDSAKYGSRMVATAQIDKVKPTIHVWDPTTMNTMCILELKHADGVNCLSFSKTRRYLLSVGVDESRSITVWEWEKGTIRASGQAETRKIFDAKFRPDSDTDFVTVGIKHVKFWKVVGSQIVGEKPVLKTAERPEDAKRSLHTMLSVAFAPDSITYTGCVTGDVYVWINNKLQRVIVKAHNGPVMCMYTSLLDGLVVTGAKEKRSSTGQNVCVKLWDQQMQRSPKKFPFQGLQAPEIVKSVCRCKDKIIAGTKNCEIIEFNEKTGVIEQVVSSHDAGELWGLTAHPSSDIIATCSYDHTLRIWDLPKKKAICCSFSSDGMLLAVGFMNGEISIFNVTDLTIFAKRRDRNSEVFEIRFSPNMQWLAVGLKEATVDIYDMGQGKTLPRIAYCKSIKDDVMHMDFAVDSDYLRISTLAFEVLVFKVPSCELLTSPEEINKIIWATWTDVCGSEVAGLWSDGYKEKRVYGADLANNSSVLVVGDNEGFVKQYGFPCTSKQTPIKYVGHSAHVTNVKFTFDDTYLVSTGGDDASVFVWRCVGRTN